jgi:ferredoxin
MLWHQLRFNMMRPLVNEDLCIGCGACFSVCPADPKVMEHREIEDKGRKSVIAHPEGCDFGGACVNVCPTGAFQLVNQ